MMLITCSGCIGGKKVNASSAGRVITSSELIRQPNGVYKLKPVKIEAVKSRPVPIEPKSAVGKPVRIEPKSAVGKPTPFEPTVKEATLSPAEVLIEDLKNVGKENNINVGSSTTIGKGDGPKIAGPCKGEPTVKINWMELIKFSLAAALFLAFLYIGFKVARRKTERMIGRERKVAKKRKAPKKRAAKKRK